MNITIKANIEDTGKFKLAWQDLMNPLGRPVKKLTQDIFFLLQCSPEIKIAVLNKDGDLFFGTFEDAEPNLSLPRPHLRGTWAGKGKLGEWSQVCGHHFDASDWPNGCKVIRKKK